MGEIKGEEGGIVSSVHISPADPGKPHDLVNVRSRGKSTGMLVVAAGDGVVLAARLLGPQAHEHTEAGSILDRCVSLVQSIARDPALDMAHAVDVYDAFVTEARAIAHDAGWK